MLIFLLPDIYEDLVSPVTAAQALLLSTIRKRKEMLEKTMVFLMQVLTTPNVDPRHKDGVMHMVNVLLILVFFVVSCYLFLVFVKLFLNILSFSFISKE